MLFVVLLAVPANNLAPSVTANPEMCWLIGVSLELDAIMLLSLSRPCSRCTSWDVKREGGKWFKRVGSHLRLTRTRQVHKLKRVSDLPDRHVPVSFAIKILRRSITREYFWSDIVILWQNPKRTPDLSPSHSLTTERLFLSSFFPSLTLYLHPQHLLQPLPRGGRWGVMFFDPSSLSWRARPGALPSTRERARPAADSPQNSISNSVSVRACSAEGDQGSGANEPRKSPLGAPPARASSSRTCSSQLKYQMLHESTETKQKKTAHLWMLAWGKSCPTAESRKNLASFPAVRNAWKKKGPTKTRSQPLDCVNRL